MRSELFRFNGLFRGTVKVRSRYLWVVTFGHIFFTEEALHVRLLACHRSGTVDVYTLVNPESSGRIWTVSDVIEKLDGSDHPMPRGSFVINAKNGASRAAARQNFSEALEGRAGSPRSKEKKEDGKAHCFWISVGEKGARCIVNYTGNRVGKVDWGKGVNVECVEVIDRSGASC